MQNLTDITDYINRTLEVDRFADYCPNGLQVAGREKISHIVSGVTASQEFLADAIAAGADVVLVHHGYFWKGEEPSLVGMRYARIKRLMDAGIGLLAYHLPLDTHPTLGNNCEIGRRLEIASAERHAAGGVEGLLWMGDLSEPLPVTRFVDRVSRVLGRPALDVGRSAGSVSRVAWCSGGGQRFVTTAAALGADAYLSGEISEQTTHEARENNILYVAAGHHATERFGVQALGAHVAEEFGIRHTFIDIPNPA